MSRWLQKPTTLLLALWLALMVSTLAHAEGPEPLKIVLEVSDTGYNCLEGCDVVSFADSAWYPSVEVDQGQLVELTFIWAHEAYPYEEHIVVLDGYRLEWDKIDADNREATLQFIADQPGSFVFKCDLKCDLHDHMQRANLTVRRGLEEGAAPEFTPTSLILSVSPSASLAAGETLTLKAVLKDAEGAPVPRAQIQFFVDAEFAGVRDEMEIGKATTGTDGVAALDYRPTLALQEQNITARFTGMGIYAESQAAAEIQVFGELPLARSVAPTGLENIGGLARTAFVLVVLGVWGIFAFVLYQLLGIARAQEQ